MIYAYVGSVESANFDWDAPKTKWNGNMPERVSEFLPNSNEIFKRLWELSKSGREDIKQLDWGAVGAKMTGRELSAFITGKLPLENDKVYILYAFEE